MPGSSSGRSPRSETASDGGTPAADPDVFGTRTDRSAGAASGRRAEGLLTWGDAKKLVVAATVAIYMGLLGYGVVWALLWITGGYVG